jgi:ABC-2 type transport system permease protein
MRDTLLILRNELLITVRNPFWIFFGLFQPVVYLLLFAPFLKGLTNTPGFPAENAIQFFAPGLLIMNAMFNAGYAGFGVMDKLQSGFIERLRVTPINRLSLVLGFVLVSGITLLFQSVILIAVALIFGLKINIAGTVLLVLLLLLIGVAMASFSFALGILIKDGGVLAGAINFFTLPLLLLSGIMLPLQFAPKLIQSIAKVDPFAYAVDAARALMDGAVSNADVPMAFAVFAGLSIVALYCFIKVMREAVA